NRPGLPAIERIAVGLGPCLHDGPSASKKGFMDTEIKIRKITSVPLLGESPKGGWSSEIRPEDSIHTLIAVHTDAGITGYGSAFTNGGLVGAALKVLEPLFAGRNALEPERTTELLHQNTFWMG